VTANSFSRCRSILRWFLEPGGQEPLASGVFQGRTLCRQHPREDQIELSNRFAKSSPEKFVGLDMDIGLGGVPLLRGCGAWLQCRVVSRVPGGDHTIYIGEVD